MGPLNKDTGRRPKGQGGLWAASARISATVAGTNNAELLLDKLLMAKREKKLDTSG
jgi:hypothetical protein